jgi:hypothetical protein
LERIPGKHTISLSDQLERIPGKQTRHGKTGDSETTLNNKNHWHDQNVNIELRAS